MALAELVMGIENGTLVRREPSKEEIREKFEYFRERNYLVEEVLEGKTTFSKALRSSEPWLKRLLPFTKKSEDFRNLEYLLAVPIAYEGRNVRKSSLEKPIIVPQDYYDRPLHYPLRESDLPVRVFNGMFHIAKYIAAPFIAGIIAGKVTNAISSDATASVAYGTMAITAAGFAVWDIYRTVTLPRHMINRARMLDKAVADVFNPTLSDGSRETSERRHTLATQWLDDVSFNYNQKKYERAIDFALKAVKSDPLNFRTREMLISIYSITNDTRCFDELREARIIFGGRVNELDMRTSTLYGKLNDTGGYQNKVIDSAMSRAGIGAAIGLGKSMGRDMPS